MDTPETRSSLPVAIRCGISGLCILLLAIDLILGIPQRHGFSGFEAVLVLAGLAPWVIGVVESISFGGALLKLRVDKNEQDIETLKFLVELALSEHELHCLYSLQKNMPFKTNTADPLAYEGAFKPAILRLRGHGLLENRPNMGFPDLERHPKGERDAGNHFKVTKKGERYLEEYERATGRTLHAEDFGG